MTDMARNEGCPMESKDKHLSERRLKDSGRRASKVGHSAERRGRNAGGSAWTTGEVVSSGALVSRAELAHRQLQGWSADPAHLERPKHTGYITQQARSSSDIKNPRTSFHGNSIMRPCTWLPGF